MTIIYLTFMIDDGEKIILVHRLWTRMTISDIEQWANILRYRDLRDWENGVFFFRFFHNQRSKRSHVEFCGETNDAINFTRR